MSKSIKKNKEDIIPLSKEEIEEEKSKYTRKIYTPIYEPSKTKPIISDLYETSKRDELLKEIDEDEDLSDEMRDFLISAAERHTLFNFSKIADFYSHLPVRYKSHFENSALVIIDYDKAVRNGFISFEKEVDISRINYLENIITTEKLSENRDEVSLKREKQALEEKEEIERKKKLKGTSVADNGYILEDEF